MKPRRSNLSVPGHMAKMHAKALSSAADVIMLDLEDSVPIEEKEAARAQVIESLNSLDWSAKTVTVRIILPLPTGTCLRWWNRLDPFLMP